MEHRYHSSVFIRQFHHRLVQPFLELGQVSFPHRTAGGCCLDEFLVVLNAGIDIIQAELKTPATLFEKVQRHVDRDGMDPGVERRLAAEPADRLVSFVKMSCNKSFVSSWFEVML